MKSNVKKYTEKAAAVAVNKLLTAARKGARTLLYNTWTDAAGRCCCCDGFRAYRINTAPAGVKEDEWTDRDRAPAGYDLLDKCMSPVVKRAAVEIPAPDFAAVAAARKDKNNTAHIYDLGPGAPCLNVVYLYELLQLFPAARWYIDADAKNRYIAPVYVVCDEGDAMLMPVRVAYKYNEAPEAAQTVQEAPAATAQDAPEAAQTVQEAPAATAQDAPEAAQTVQEAPAATAQDAPEAAQTVQEAPAVREKSFIGSRLVGPGYEIFFDAALQRTRVIFTAEPSAERVAAVTESGFLLFPLPEQL